MHSCFLEAVGNGRLAPFWAWLKTWVGIFIHWCLAGVGEVSPKRFSALLCTSFLGPLFGRDRLFLEPFFFFFHCSCWCLHFAGFTNAPFRIKGRQEKNLLFSQFLFLGSLPSAFQSLFMLVCCIVCRDSLVVRGKSWEECNYSILGGTRALKLLFVKICNDVENVSC